MKTGNFKLLFHVSLSKFSSFYLEKMWSPFSEGGFNIFPQSAQQNGKCCAFFFSNIMITIRNQLNDLNLIRRN